MYKPTAHLDNQMILPGDFFLPFGGNLDEENRWVKLSTLVRWSHAEKTYGAFFKDSFRGQQAISLRKGLGALLIQERMQLTDRETVESISENPYMQYFIGLASFEMKAPFHHSMMTHFRKRLVNVLAEINEIVAIEGAKAAMDDDNNYPDGGTKGNVQARSKEPAPSPSSGQQEWEFEETEGRSAEHEIHHEPIKKATLTEASPIADEAAAHRTSSCKTPPAVMNENAPTLPNQGSLLVDATCAPADIAYPTDLNLLNEAREKLESIIDVLHRPMIGIEPKPRTYREKARKQYLVVSKQRRAGAKVIRKAIGRQLRYIERDLEMITRQTQRQPLTRLSRKSYRDLLVIQELYRQQLHMYKQRSHQVEDRIVSIHQPHIRPIVRGKAKARVEFGAKLAMSMAKGYAFLDHQSWDNFNESTTLIESIENYRRRMGFYPAVVQADQIYRTRENRTFCKQYGIRLSGPALGARPKMA